MKYKLAHTGRIMLGIVGTQRKPIKAHKPGREIKILLATPLLSGIGQCPGKGVMED